MNWPRFQSGIDEGLAILVLVVFVPLCLFGTLVAACNGLVDLSCATATNLLLLWIGFLVALWLYALVLRLSRLPPNHSTRGDPDEY